jgi:hypothetical protein
MAGWVYLNLRFFVRHISKLKYRKTAWVNLKPGKNLGIFKFEICFFADFSGKIEPKFGYI